MHFADVARGKLKKELSMKLSKSYLLAAGFLALTATTSFAANDNAGKVYFSDTVTVDGKQLKPGDYKLEWTGSGPSVELKIIKGKETVATVPAQIIPDASTNDKDSHLSTIQPDGSRSLVSISLKGKNFDIQIAPQQSAAKADATAAGQK
jgi:hypothetical protein